MKKLIHNTRCIFLVLVVLSCQYVFAYDFKADYSFSTEGTESIPRDVTVTLYYLINPDGNSVSVTKGEEVYADDIVFIPETVEHEGRTYSVTKIGYQAFQNSKCKYVKMPDTIVKLEDYCFASSSVGNVTFSKNIEEIGQYAFQSCRKIQSVEFYDGLISIGDGAFLFCDYLSEVVLPSSLELLGSSCFYSTTNLSSITIPEKIRSIPNSCFGNVSGLKKIILPEGLTSIGENAFDQSKLEDIELPSTIISIGYRAFAQTKLKTIILPEGLLSLGRDVFTDCNELESISFPGTLETVPYGACSYCKKLQSVNLTYGIKKLEGCAFCGTSLLTRITIPESVEEFGNGLFSGSGLTSFTFPLWIDSYSKSSDLFSCCYRLQEVYMGDNVTDLGEYTFNGCSALGKVRLSESLKELPTGLFYGCTSLQISSIPNNVERIGGSCFYGVPMLREMIIPEKVKRIEGFAFASSGIRKLYMPYATEYVGYGLLSNTNEVEEVHIKRTTPPTGWHSSNPYIGPNTATLYVPTGSLDAYKANEYWSVFSNIVEEDVPDVYFQIAYQAKEGKGTATVNDEAFENGVKEIMLSAGAVVKFIPENTGYASTSYLLDRVMLNGKDITNELVDNAYTIEKVETNYNFEAYYRIMPLTLRVLNGNGGSVDLDVEKGKSVTFTVTPDEEWIVSSVYFNGYDYAQNVIDGNKVTTPAIYDSSTISVTYQQATGINSSRNNSSSVKAFGSADGTIHVVGAAPSSVITLCDIDGKVITTVKASMGETRINAVPGKVYIVKNSSTVLKLAL